MEDPSDLTRLLPRWCSLLPAGSARTAAVSAGRALLRRWGEPHRHHHTSEHLVAVLDLVEANAMLAADADLVALAAWFHDAVYDPRATDNEDRSATVATLVLDQLGIDPGRVAEVARLVRLTATHRPQPGDTNGALLIDADLAILAATPEAYNRYAHQIRREYQHLDDTTYRIGRIAVLRRLAGEPALYHLVDDRTAWETRARANMWCEIERLDRSVNRTQSAVVR